MSVYFELLRPDHVWEHYHKTHYSADNGAMKWRTSHTQKGVLMPRALIFDPKE